MFWPPDSHCTIGHGIAHGPCGPDEATARARAANRLRSSRSARVRLPRARPSAASRAAWARPSRACALAQARGDAGERVAAGADRLGLAFPALGERRQHVPLAARVRACGAHEAEHARVRPLDAAHERQSLEQLREAVGVQHDGDEVRAVAHVVLAQQRAELHAHLREPRAQPVHTPARLRQPRLGRGEPRRRRRPTRSAPPRAGPRARRPRARSRAPGARAARRHWPAYAPAPCRRRCDRAACPRSAHPPARPPTRPPARRRTGCRRRGPWRSRSR